jgi:hypothetical protein
LAEIDFAPHIIAGTSSGALNGAILGTIFTFLTDRAIAPRKFCAASGNIKAIKRRSTNILIKTE